MTTGSVGSTTATGTQIKSSKFDMKTEDFIRMMITQLQNQDPMEPAKNEELLAQMSQIGQLQSSTALQESLKGLVLQNQIGAAGNLIGKLVAGVDELQKSGRMEEAVACYREALRMKPDYGDACYYLGNVLQELGRPGEAAAQYERALALNPSDAAAHNNLGLALEATGRLADAAAHYRAAIGLRPDLAQARANLARVSR
jgi:tetratricopeptide (TPR) repeat protein